MLIFATSSTVIRPHDLFAWLDAHVFRDEVALRRFVAFWGFAWFAVVKGWHAAEFAILFALIASALGRTRRWAYPGNIPPSAALCLLFAASDEFHQTFVPGRGGTWRDVVIDAIGVGLAATVTLLRGWARRRAIRDPGG